MQRTTCDCESEQQAAGRIFVVGIILNNSGLCPGLLDFGIANISLNRALEGMAAELEFTSCELSVNVASVFIEGGSTTIAEAFVPYNTK
jgi:hypothetical protein